MRESLVMHGLDVAERGSPVSTEATPLNVRLAHIFSLAAAEYIHLLTVSLFTQALHGVRRSHLSFNRLHYEL